MISVLLIVILLLILFVKYIQIQVKVNSLKKIAGNIPGPKPLPLFGNSLSFGINSYDSFQYLQKVTKQYGPTTAIWFGSKLEVFISHKEDIKAILTNNEQITKSNMYDFMLAWIGRGLVTSDGNRWRHNRKILTPTFHFKMLENYTNIFNSNYKILTDLLENEIGNNGFNIEVYLGNCVTDCLYESALRIKGDAQLNKNSKFSESQMKVKLGVGERIYKVWLHPKILFDLTPSGKGYNEGLGYLKKFVNQVIFDKKKVLKEKLIQDKEEEHKEKEITGTKKLSFIDLMLQIATNPNSYLTDEDLHDEVSTFIAAGHGTITTALGFVLNHLAERQDIQSRVVQEIEDHFGDDKRPPTYQDFQHFPYLEMVIKETLRLYPITYLGRRVNADFPLPSGYIVPAGCCVVFDFLQLHKDPAEYSDPETFNPDNFLPEQCKKRHPFSYVPFSAGPRNCIGQKYAMVNLKTGLIHLLRNYKFFIAEKLPRIKVGYAILLHSTTGINLFIQKRQISAG